MDIFLARQPILTSTRSLFGFELLYRNGTSNAFAEGLDGNSATYSVITNALLTFDLDTLTQGKPAFVNFTRDLLIQDVPELLDPEQFAIEILEDVVLDAPVIEKLYKYKEAGYMLVLDDYIGNEVPMEALDLIDIIKVDFLLTSKETRKDIAQFMISKGKHLLAEKVETLSEFQEAAQLGYEFFQGYYFSKPIVLRESALQIASSSYSRLMRELTEEEINYDRLTAVIQPDAHLTYKLLKKMNSVEYYRGQTVKSLKAALVRMGSNEVKRWGMLILMQSLVGDEMDELVRCGLIRAVFCERLSQQLGLLSRDIGFYTGMLSIIAQENKNFHEIIDSLGLPDCVAEAIRGGNQLGDILQLALNYESGRWEDVRWLLKNNFPDLTIDFLANSYLDSVNYADSIFKGP